VQSPFCRWTCRGREGEDHQAFRHVAGGERAAAMYSLIGSAKLNGVDRRPAFA
jgi:hypothetical protein